MGSQKNLATGAENTRWNLDFLYSSVSDSQLDLDIAELVKLTKKFQADYRGRLSEKLGTAISDFSAIETLKDKVLAYLYLKQSLDVADAEVKSKMAEVEKILSGVSGEYLTFFKLELVLLPQQKLDELYENDFVVARHKPWIENARIFAPHFLSEQVESALTKRSPFCESSWGQFFDEIESDLRFCWKREKKSLVEMLHILTESRNGTERSGALAVINNGLGGTFAKYSAQTLYMVAGAEEVERQERGYKNPMESRNKANHIPDEVVNALHQTVLNIAGPLAKRFYRLKAAHLGLRTLKWSDRNAPMAFSDKNAASFADALSTVIAAYKSFSPTLAGIIREAVKLKRIDAPAVKGKRGGAFNYSIVLPNSESASFTFLNYLGSNRDIMVLAHELGHGAHGILAGKAQGPLMAHAPTAYAETASVFGEMTTFNFLRAKLVERGETKSLLALTMHKIDDMINTMVRQISFSNFERLLHGMDGNYETWSTVKKLSVEELDANWLKVTKEFYGEDGEVFTYDNMEHLWAYIGHFHRPFYVYGYAFGELLTNSLYAVRNQFDDEFEPLYLDLLRAGNTKGVVDLVAPFGLHPQHEDFWAKGIEVSLGALLKEAERLSANMGVQIS